MSDSRRSINEMNTPSFCVLLLLLATLPLAVSSYAQSRQLTEVAPPGLDFRPEFRQEESYRVMTNESIAMILNRVAPRLVDASGGSLDKTPGLVVGFVTESGPEVLNFGTKMIGRAASRWQYPIRARFRNESFHWAHFGESGGRRRCECRR